MDAEGRIAGLYDLEGTIGRGHFAVVKLARHVFSGEKVAVKVIDKTRLDSVSKEHLFQEVMCMKLVQHPNVVRLYEVIDTTNKLYLILELGEGGDLYDYIMKHDQGLPEDDARNYFRQIVTAISYCHELHVVHRDLKPENVVFFKKLGLVKLTDFGFSNSFVPGKPLETFCGSLAYSAPEILLGDAYDPPKVDIWSLGVILYMLVCGELPFHEANDSETLSKIMDCKYILPTRLSRSCTRLVAKLLVRDPDKRASLTEVISDEWLQMMDRAPLQMPVFPLISREQLCFEDHIDIVNKMVDGKLATRQEIKTALDADDYNYISATYFLLAERKLKRNYAEQLLLARQKEKDVRESIRSTTEPPVFEGASADVVSSALTVNTVRILDPAPTNAPEERMRRFSMILEDEEEEEDELSAGLSLASVQLELECAFFLNPEGESCLPGTEPPNPVSRSNSRASNSGHSDGADSDGSTGPLPRINLRHKAKQRRPIRRSMACTTSSPHLLNYIREEDTGPSGHTAHAQPASAEADDITKRRSLPVSRRRHRGSSNITSPTYIRRFRRASTGSRPTLGNQHSVERCQHSKSSRSSSENSDNEADLWTCRKCGATLNRTRRQDSDHSSDGGGWGDGGSAPPRQASAERSSSGVTGGGGNGAGGGGSSGGSGGGGAGGNTLSEGLCTPIHEEEEAAKDSTINTSDASDSVPPLLTSTRSVDGTPAKSRQRLTQSNLSLCSLASSLRSSKFVIDALRKGNFDLVGGKRSTTESWQSGLCSLQSLTGKQGVVWPTRDSFSSLVIKSGRVSLVPVVGGGQTQECTVNRRRLRVDVGCCGVS